MSRTDILLAAVVLIAASVAGILSFIFMSEMAHLLIRGG